MSLRLEKSLARIALAIVFTIGGSFSAHGQGPFGPVAEPYTPTGDAKDLKAVLFKWMWSMGMLKGHDERDMVATLEYQGKGTIQVDGQPCTLTKYRASTNYQSFSQRINYACTKANGETYSNVEVVSGLYAWSESGPVPRAHPRPRWQGQRTHGGWELTQARFSPTASRQRARRRCHGRM